MTTVFKDLQGVEIKQGDVVVIPVDRHSVGLGIAKSLGWSKTYNKYNGIKFSINFKSTYNTTRTVAASSKDIIPVFVVEPKDTSAYQEKIDLCKSERWETQPNRQADGTKVLTFLTYSLNPVKYWIRAERERQANIKSYNNNPGQRNYYGYRKPKDSPESLQISSDTSKGTLVFKFTVTASNSIDYTIALNSQPIDLVGVISTFNLPPAGVFTRVSKIVEEMKTALI